MKSAMTYFGGLAMIVVFAAGASCRDSNRNAATNGNEPVGGVPTATANTPAPSGGYANQAAADQRANPMINPNAGATAVPANQMMGAPPPGAIGGGPSRLSDGDIAAITNAINQGEVQQAQIARTRARSPEVRQFAEHMATMHQQLMQQQTQLLGRSGVAPVDSETSRRMMQEGTSVMQSLQGATAEDFDRTYIDAQIREHQQALQSLDSQLVPNAQNPQFRQMLTDTRAAVQQHLDSARLVQQSLMRTGTGSGTVGAPTGGMPGMQAPAQPGGSHGMPSTTPR